MNKDKKVCIKFKFSKLQNFIGLFSVNKNSLYKNKHILKSVCLRSFDKLRMTEESEERKVKSEELWMDFINETSKSDNIRVILSRERQRASRNISEIKYIF